MRIDGILRLLIVTALTAGTATFATAQEVVPPTREAAIAQEQAEKAQTLRPYTLSREEVLFNKAEVLLADGLPWYPYFENAYAGGGFTVGVGRAIHVSPYNMLNVRGSYSILGYKRAEAEFTAPRLFDRRGALSVLGGWREATQVGFYGLGTNTSKHNRTNYDFQEPYGSAALTLWPTRRLLMLRGGVELSQWSQRPGEGRFPSVETVFTPETLPGLGIKTTYVHSHGTLGYDWRTSPGYSRRGGFYGVTLHDYTDRDKAFGFRQVDYEAVQHFPILRESWVVSLHGLAQTTFTKNDQEIPFFMLPSVGGGSTLRGFSSWRFRDANSLLLQAEWRIMANNFFDTAVFYDAGKVAARKTDLEPKGLKSDYGFGLRFHGPLATPLRVEVARSREGLTIVFASSAAF
jgi:hypothetical protein